MPPVYRTKQLKKLNRGRVDFKPEEFRRQILTKGMDMLWEQAARCPCERIIDDGSYRQGTGEFQSDCPECYGRGVIYHSGIQIRALFENAAQNPSRFSMYGESGPGMAGITVLPEHACGFLDRFTLVDNIMVYNEARVRSNDVVERLRWPIATRSVEVGRETDPTETEILSVSAAYVRKADVFGNIQAGVLEESVDFAIVNSAIDWSLGDARGTAPNAGQKYSVQYYGHPTFIVRDFPFVIRDTYIIQKSSTESFRPLPQRTTCWLEYLGRPEWPQGVA